MKLKTIAIAATLLIVKRKLSETDSLHLKFGILKTRNLTSGGMLLNVLLECRPLAALRLSGPNYKYTSGIDSLSSHEIANMINVKFLEPMQTYQSIDPPPPFESIPDLSQISVEAVLSILKKLPHKAPGPDGIPNWILKEYALILLILFVTSFVAPLLINVFLLLGNWLISSPYRNKVQFRMSTTISLLFP